MDINAFLQSCQHNGWLMLGLGMCFSQRLKILHYAVLAVLKVPMLRAIALGHPREVLDIIDAFRKEVAEDLADLQKQQPAPAAPAPKP